MRRWGLFAVVLGVSACGGDSSSGDEGSAATEGGADESTVGQSQETETSAMSTTTGDSSADEGGDGNGGDGNGDDGNGDDGGDAESSTGSTDELGEMFELRVGDFEVPTLRTSYNCWDFSFSLDQLGHLTAFEAVVDNAAYVHHFVVTLTANPSGSPDGYSCYDLEGDMIWAWAPGETRFELPPEAGFLVGDTPGGNVTLRLQVHYNNPLGTSGQTDNSGFNFWVTEDLRENNAGTLVFGDIEGIEIPPGMPDYEHVMTCRGEVTQSQLPGPLRVFSSALHAHNLGSVLYSEVWRDGDMILEMNRDDPFNFENQNLKPVDFDLMPGDQIVNHCIYDSTERDETTFGGPGTDDEMCWNTISYYPKLPSGFDYCSSFD